MDALEVGGPRPLRGLFLRMELPMAARKPIPQQIEPLGIVISNGDRDEPAPVFWSYEWAEVPISSSGNLKKNATH